MKVGGKLLSAATGRCYYCSALAGGPHLQFCSGKSQSELRQAAIRQSQREEALQRERQAARDKYEEDMARAVSKRQAAIDAGAPEERIHRDGLLFVLRANGFTYREIADRLGVSMGTVQHTDQVIMRRITYRFQAMVDVAEFRSTLSRSAIKSWREFDSMMAL